MSANVLLEMIKKKYSRINKNEKISIKSAGKNIKFNIIDSITYNLIESMTKYKNKEIDKNNLNKELSINLSFLLFNCNTRKKINKEEDNSYWKTKGKYPIKNFGIYFPINRITFLEEEKLINKNKNIKNNNINKNSLKTQKLDIFLPSSIIFTEKKSKKFLDLSYNSNNNKTFKKSKNPSFISEDSFNSNHNTLNISTESIENINENDKNEKNKEKKFDYIECPLIQKKSKKDKVNNFIRLLNELDDLIDSEEIDNINNKSENNNIIFNNKLNEDKEPNQEILDNNKKIDLLDPLYTNKYLKEEYDINNANLENNKKFFKKMNENYANIIHEIFMRLIKCSIINYESNEKFKGIDLKKIIVICFKQLLLLLGLSNKNIFEKIFKNYILSGKLFSFNKFIKSFDTIIFDKDFQNMKLKYLFLLTITTTQDLLGYEKKICDEFLDNKKIENFFELIGCNYAYIETFSENLGQKLIMRYKAVYKNEEKYNILEGKYSLRKMRITLESFFDQIQKDD